MAIDITGILDAVASHALASGWFDQVNQHEPASAPGSGLTCAIWVDRVAPVQSSGLASTSARIVVNVRLYMPVTSEPADQIDPTMTAALDALLRAYVGDFTLGGLVRYVDVRGIDGEPLSAQAGYLPFPDGGLTLRVYTVSLPLVVNDLWDEAS